VNLHSKILEQNKREDKLILDEMVLRYKIVDIRLPSYGTKEHYLKRDWTD
jgi:hypothetical protein